MMKKMQMDKFVFNKENAKAKSSLKMDNSKEDKEKGNNEHGL